MPSIQNLASFIMVRPLLCSWPTKGDAMRRFVLMLGWVLWAHEMAVVGDKLLDRGYTAIDSFETRQQCNTAMADYASLKLVQQGRVRVEFSCLPGTVNPKASKTAIG